MSHDTPDPLLIVADNYRMAAAYARDHNLGPENRHRWIYVTEPRHVQGRRGGRFVYLTAGKLTFAESARRRDVLTALRMHGFTEERRNLDGDTT